MDYAAGEEAVKVHEGGMWCDETETKRPAK